MRARCWPKPSIPAAMTGLALFLILPTWGGCGGEGGDPSRRQVPAAMRTRFNTEMMTILRDIRLAEETARAVDGAYVDWQELRRSYLSRNIPSNYKIRLQDLTATSYRAVILHTPSGLRCWLEVADATATGSPSCD